LAKCNLVEFESNDANNYADLKSEQIPPIYMNQSNNIHIVAKYGTTVNLPCIIYKLKNQDLSQVSQFCPKKLKLFLFLKF
jgi:hypothetical protein